MILRIHQWPHHRVLIAAVLVSLWSTLSGCALFQKNQQATDEISDDDAYSDGTATNNPKTTLPHPIIPDAWHTNRLVMTKKIPSKNHLNNCRSDLAVIGTQIANDEAMVEAIDMMRESVTSKTNFYHWCFYYSMSVLDWGMENDTKRASLQEQQDYFHRNMRGLFVLARALDQTRNTKRYFFYIRRRYMELSQNYFGRTLDVIAPPVDVLVPAGNRFNPRTKPAGPNSRI